MKALKYETTMTIFLTSIVTAIAVLIVSPLSISLAFWLNGFLARPILSLEYTEVITEKRKKLPPKEAINKIITSQYYQSSVMKGRAGTANMLITYNSKNELTDSDTTVLKSILNCYIKSIEDRNKFLKDDLNKLNAKNLSDDSLWELALSYIGAIRPEKLTLSQSEILKKSLIGKIIEEINDGEKIIEIGQTALKKLNTDFKNDIENIYFKISVQNRGSTDGLVRAVGKIEIPDADIMLPIIKCRPPSKKNLMAIAVTVVDDVPDIASGTSVGKVEMHSLKEFWYTINTKENIEYELAKFIDYTSLNNTFAMIVKLIDHENGGITKRFTTSI